MGKLEEHFEHLHNNPPPPMNPDYDPKAKDRALQVAQSMEEDGFYDNHTRHECADEFRRRTKELKEQADAKP